MILDFYRGSYQASYDSSRLLQFLFNNSESVSGVTCDYPGKNGTKEPLAALKEYFLRFSDEIESLLLLIGFTHVDVAVEGVS